MLPAAGSDEAGCPESGSAPERRRYHSRPYYRAIQAALLHSLRSLDRPWQSASSKPAPAMPAVSSQGQARLKGRRDSCGRLMALLLCFSLLACLLPASLWGRLMLTVSTLYPHCAGLLVPAFSPALAGR